ncbi:hypothetical protein ENBRE01_1891 [Enteropsectra breve]|nr:hypothetical protein ENBRE01_1891 [Enteropsectra breve]
MNCCCFGERKPIVLFATGKTEDKNRIFQDVFQIETSEKKYNEYSVNQAGETLLFQDCDLTDGLSEIAALHAQLSHGMICISDVDEAVDSDKPIFFVLMNKQSKQQSDENTTVVSYDGTNRAQILAAFKQFIKKNVKK